MERRALVAVAISIAILILYQEFILKRYFPPASEHPHVEAPGADMPPPPAVEQPAPAPVESAAAAPAAARPKNAPEVVVDTDLYRAVFTAAGGRLRSLELKHYRATNHPDSPLLELVVPGSGDELPMGLALQAAQAIKDDDVVYEIKGGPLALSGEQQGKLTLVWHTADITVEKRLTFTGNTYPIGLEIAVLQGPPDLKEIGVAWVKGVDPKAAATRGSVYTGIVALVNNKLQHRTLPDLEKGEVLTGSIGWAGYGDTYFLSAVIPEDSDNARLWLKTRDHTAEARVLVRPSEAKTSAFQLFVGPKEYDTLEAVHHGLVKAIDLGYFFFIATPMLRVLKLSHGLTGNYGIDVILLTLAIKILFIPLTQKSFKSMREMQKLQPQMAKLREKMKDKPDELNKEMMELYRRHKVNPLSGCLPMVLQIPVFIGLYNALLNAIELRHAPFAFWITDLSAPDRLGAVALPFVDPPGIPVLTLVMGATMFAQQRMTPSTGDPAQQRMMMVMPLVFTFMFINFPAGLVLYWLVNNVLTIAQQYAMTKRT